MTCASMDGDETGGAWFFSGCLTSYGEILSANNTASGANTEVALGITNIAVVRCEADATLVAICALECLVGILR